MTSSPLVQNKNLLDTNPNPNLSPKSPTQNDPLGSPNLLAQPKYDVEPNQPLFNKNELLKSDMLKSNLTSGENQLLQTAMRMKDQNTKLKTQLKQLKLTLKETLIKVQAKNKQNDKDVDLRETELNRELNDNHQQIGLYKKEIQAMKNRLEGLHNQERVMKMENLLKDKNRQIDDMTAEKRNLEKIKLDQDHELDRLQKEFGYEKRIQSSNEEARQIREKIKKVQSVNKNNDHIFKNQQEYLVVLSNQYRMICDKLGVAPSMNFTRAEELTNIISQKQKEAKEKAEEIASFKTTVAAKNRRVQKAKTAKESSTPSDSKPIEPTKENVQKLEKHIEELKTQADDLEKNYAKDISAAQAEKQTALAKLKELETRLKDKEKEASILAHRAKELKRIVRFNAVSPLAGATA